MRRAVGDAGMRLRAAEMGRRIRAEDGVGQAVALFQQQIGAIGPFGSRPTVPPLAA